MGDVDRRFREEAVKLRSYNRLFFKINPHLGKSNPFHHHINLLEGRHLEAKFRSLSRLFRGLFRLRVAHGLG